MARNEETPRRNVLKSGLAITLGCFAAHAARSAAADIDEYNQPKLDRRLVKFQNFPGPDNHQCGLCTNFIPPNACRVVDGTVTPTSYCLSFAPKDIDF